MPGARPHPQPRMRMKKAHELVTTGQPNNPAFPARLVLTVSFALSPVIGLSCHCHRRRCESIIANLTSASRCQDHTTSPSETARSSAAQASSIASRANVRDDRDTPLLWAGTGGACRDDLPVGARGNFVFTEPLYGTDRLSRARVRRRRRTERGASDRNRAERLVGSGREMYLSRRPDRPGRENLNGGCWKSSTATPHSAEPPPAPPARRVDGIFFSNPPVELRSSA